jgi:hypothetical protein
MDHAIIPDPLKDHIAGFSGPIELRDQSGCILGVFTPAKHHVPVEPELTLEQVRAIVAEPGGYTLEEIWRELGAK